MSYRKEGGGGGGLWFFSELFRLQFRNDSSKRFGSRTSVQHEAVPW